LKKAISLIEAKNKPATAAASPASGAN